MQIPKDTTLPELQKAFKQLWEDMNRLRKDNQALRDRIAKLEAQ